MESARIRGSDPLVEVISDGFGTGSEVRLYVAERISAMRESIVVQAKFNAGFLEINQILGLSLV